MQVIFYAWIAVSGDGRAERTGGGGERGVLFGVLNAQLHMLLSEY